MATLDEKFLDGPNVGYCSDSDEDDTVNNGSEIQPVSAITSSGQQRSGVSTGPKGVLADYRQYEKDRAAERRKSELQIFKEAKRLTLERGGNRSPSEDEAEEDDLDQIRKRRLEQLRNFCRGRIIEIPDSNEFLSVIENTRKVFVFIHIYRDGLDAVKTLNDALLEMAAKYEKEAKFYKVKASVLGTSGNFTANALPALQVYQNGDLVGNFVRITDELGEDFSCNQLCKFLDNNKIDFE